MIMKIFEKSKASLTSMVTLKEKTKACMEKYDQIFNAALKTLESWRKLGKPLPQEKYLAYYNVNEQMKSVPHLKTSFLNDRSLSDDECKMLTSAAAKFQSEVDVLIK